jgi:hypothetical protein
LFYSQNGLRTTTLQTAGNADASLKIWVAEPLPMMVQSIIIHKNPTNGKHTDRVEGPTSKSTAFNEVVNIIETIQPEHQTDASARSL